jgi:hypothetical protein
MNAKYFLILPAVFLTFSGCSVETPVNDLAGYRAELEKFRLEFGGHVEMPDVRFFLFGMGDRTKLIYRNGELSDAMSGETIRKWDIAGSLIVPPDYLVSLVLTDSSRVEIREDKDAVWIDENGERLAVEGTSSRLELPDFRGFRYGRVMKVLHHEILVNIAGGKPLPNFLVYKNPWRRDAAMMAMCLNITGNINLIREWALALNDPYDRNNAGEAEADNLGQSLYLLSFFADRNHPLVAGIVDEARRHEAGNPGMKYIKGRSDFHEVPVYQTKWMKFGLAAMNMPDEYVIPALQDDYSALFWWDYKESYLPGTRDSRDRVKYPYLGWAADHFHGTRTSGVSNRDYPLTWETDASQADYNGMAVVDTIYVKLRTAAPHTWHASEVFLYLYEMEHPLCLSGKRDHDRY